MFVYVYLGDEFSRFSSKSDLHVWRHVTCCYMTIFILMYISLLIILMNTNACGVHIYLQELTTSFVTMPQAQYSLCVLLFAIPIQLK